MIGDDAIRDSIATGQLAARRARGADLTIFAPRASAMGHHLGDAATSEMIGTACGIDPETGHHYDDTKRYIERLPLSAA